ncbi:endonuclease NucS domain-containing protein [Nesterenkonia populi]
MPVEMGMWRIDGDSPQRLPSGLLPSEAQLEDFLERDPSLLGEKLLVIARQLRTPHGKLIDLLALDGDGNLHVLELKRDRTPREVVAQILDYGSWVTELGREKIAEIAAEHLDTELEQAFAEVFDAPPPR